MTGHEKITETTLPNYLPATVHQEEATLVSAQWLSCPWSPLPVWASVPGCVWEQEGYRACHPPELIMGTRKMDTPWYW